MTQNYSFTLSLEFDVYKGGGHFEGRGQINRIVTKAIPSLQHIALKVSDTTQIGQTFRLMVDNRHLGTAQLTDDLIVSSGKLEVHMLLS